MASYSRCSRSAGSHGATSGEDELFRRRRAAEQLALAERHRIEGALRGREHRVDRREGAGPVALEIVERAGGDEAFQHPLVDRARIDAPGEVGEVAEQALGARRDDASTAARADAFEGAERIDGCVAGDVEIDAGAVDRGRHDLDAEALRLAAEFGELVGVAHVERHRRRQELDRVVRLHVGRLVGDAARKAPNATC